MARFNKEVDREICGDLLSYFGYDLYGNMCECARTQSIPILLNIFFGVMVNAATGIAATIANIFSGFAFSVIQAFRPQIVKQYAAGNLRAFEMLLHRSALFTTFVYSLIALPFFVCAEGITYIWLGEIPQYSVEFIRLMLIALIFSLVIINTNIGIQATGSIRRISIICGSIYLFFPLVSYSVMKLHGAPVSTIYILNIITIAISGIIGLRILRNLIPQIKVWKIILPVIKYLFGATVIGIFLMNIDVKVATDNNILYQIFLKSLICIGLLSAASYFFIFDKDERIFIKEKLRL